MRTWRVLVYQSANVRFSLELVDLENILAVDTTLALGLVSKG